MEHLYKLDRHRICNGVSYKLPCSAHPSIHGCSSLQSRGVNSAPNSRQHRSVPALLPHTAATVCAACCQSDQISVRKPLDVLLEVAGFEVSNGTGARCPSRRIPLAAVLFSVGAAVAKTPPRIRPRPVIFSDFARAIRLPVTKRPQSATNWNDQLLADLDLVRIVERVFIGFEDPHVVVGIAVEVLCDLG
jgi:hypothetical protein